MDECGYYMLRQNVIRTNLVWKLLRMQETLFQEWAHEQIHTIVSSVLNCSAVSMGLSLVAVMGVSQELR